MATGTHAAFLNGIRDAAQARIKTGVFADAAASKAEIEQVGQSIATKSIATKYRGVIAAASGLRKALLDLGVRKH